MLGIFFCDVLVPQSCEGRQDYRETNFSTTSNHCYFQNVQLVLKLLKNGSILLLFLAVVLLLWSQPALIRTEHQKQQLKPLQSHRFAVFKLLQPSGLPPPLAAGLCTWSRISDTGCWLRPRTVTVLCVRAHSFPRSIPIAYCKLSLLHQKAWEEWSRNIHTDIILMICWCKDVSVNHSPHEIYITCSRCTWLLGLRCVIQVHIWWLHSQYMKISALISAQLWVLHTECGSGIHVNIILLLLYDYIHNPNTRQVQSVVSQEESGSEQHILQDSTFGMDPSYFLSLLLWF